MTILITGYSGFVGSHTVPKLLQAGHKLICYGRKPPVAEFKSRFVQGDLGKKENFEQIAWQELEGVLHLASAGVKAASRQADECLRANVYGLMNLLEVLRSQAPRLARIVLTPTFYERAVEQQPALLENPYIATKHLATQLFKIWAKGFPGQASLATLFQAYGPGDDSGNVLSYVAAQLRRGEQAKLGSGSGLRDWIYIDDVAAALAHLFSAHAQPGLKTHDVGTGQLVSIRHMSEQIAAAMGLPPSRLEFDPTRDRSDGGLSLAASYPLPGWSPRTSIPDGINNLIKA